MARGTSQRPQYQPNPITQGRQAAEEREAYASKVQRDDANALQQGATQAMVKSATQAGYQLPPGANQPGQSAANRAAIARYTVAQNNGNHMAANTPQMVPSHMAPGTAPASSVAANDAANLASFKAGETNPVAAAAGTGKDVLTPYGPVSSTILPPGAKDGALTGGPSSPAQANGPVHDPAKNYALGQGKNGVVPSSDAQKEILAKYPSIGDVNNPDHAAFLKAWNDSTKDAKPGDVHTDHLAIADSVAGPNSDQPTPDTAIAKADPGPAPSTATKVGQAIGSIPGNIKDSLKADYDAAKGVVSSVVGAGKDLYAGITGNQPPSYNPTQTPQDQIASVAPDAAPMSVPSDQHSDIHAATVKAITAAGQNAHDAVNAAPSFTGGVTPQAPSAPTADAPSFSPTKIISAFSPSPQADNPPKAAPVVPQNQGGSYSNY